MGVTPLTRSQWLLACVYLTISASIGAVVWYAFSSLVFSHFPRLLVVSLVLSLMLGALCLLMWTRLLLAHRFWLHIWLMAAPLVLSSSILLPVSPLIVLPLLWCV